MYVVRGSRESAITGLWIFI